MNFYCFLFTIAIVKCLNNKQNQITNQKNQPGKLNKITNRQNSNLPGNQKKIPVHNFKSYITMPKIKPEPVNKPPIVKESPNKKHILVHNLGKNTGGVPQSYIKYPYASTSFDYEPEKNVNSPDIYDKDFYFKHLPENPYEYNGSVVPDTAIPFY